MILRRLIPAFVLLPCALAQLPCLTVAGDQILGSDLARAVPALAVIPPNTPLAPAPLPGSTRVFYPSELRSVASRFSIALDSPAEVCFRFAAETLNRDQIADALRKTLNVPEARIELLETSTGPVPPGVMEFKLEHLGVPASPDQSTPVMWRGEILYAGNRRFPIWAKVRITAPRARFIALEALRSGVPVKADQVRPDLTEGFPALTSARNQTLDQIAGKIPLRSVSAGAEVRPENLSLPNAVNRGDLVHVEVRFGAAHLVLTGRAETAGRVGDTVAIRNPDSSKVFQALVEGVDRVLVESASEKH